MSKKFFKILLIYGWTLILTLVQLSETNFISLGCRLNHQKAIEVTHVRYFFLIINVESSWPWIYFLNPPVKLLTSLKRVFCHHVIYIDIILNLIIFPSQNLAKYDIPQFVHLLQCMVKFQFYSKHYLERLINYSISWKGLYYIYSALSWYSCRQEYSIIKWDWNTILYSKAFRATDFHDLWILDEETLVDKWNHSTVFSYPMIPQDKFSSITPLVIP